MKNKLLIIMLLIISTSILIKAQEPSSFFPKEIGNKWHYKDLNTGQISISELTKDSVDLDGNYYLFYDNQTNPNYLIDTAHNVFLIYNPFPNYLRYKLDADSGDAWESQPGGASWAWVARVETSFVFSQPSIIKVFQYGPVHPDSLPQPYALSEDWLASGFGLIYQWREPTDIISLIGCVIDSDTFGITTSVKMIEDNIPADFKLKQNYPNPFNPTTTIEFELSREAEVNISVYNLLGQQVSILFDGLKSAGFHKIKWDASGIASGIYLCRLQTEGNTRTIKMLFSK
jgi:hypothetical protein